MNIYRFINSKDIREHLLMSKYRFNTQEAAYLVWHCQNATLSEKEDAWNQIIKTMPNCPAPKHLNMSEIPDFHTFLKRYINIQKMMIENFIKTDNCVYSFTINYYINEIRENRYYKSNIFSDYNKCWEACIKELSNTNIYNSDSAQITKYHLNNDTIDSCEVNKQGNFLSVNCRQILNDDSLDICYAFGRMWFDFPTPFHCGDIVCDATQNKDPFVLIDICTWNEEKIRSEVPTIEHIVHKEGDYNGMAAYGYIIEEDYNKSLGVRRGLYTINYLDLEYYRKAYSYKDMLLLPISLRYAKEKEQCGIDALLNEYTLTFLRIMLENQQNCIEGFLESLSCE